MIIIDGPIPNLENLEWDSDDLEGDSIPIQDADTDRDLFWWAITTWRDISDEQYKKIYEWCERNPKYQCGLRHGRRGAAGFGVSEEYIIGYFRHPDDAVMFKMVWT